MRFKNILAFAMLCAMHSSAQGLAGAWFAPTGDFQGCLENPGIACPQTDFGPSEQEKTMHSRAISELHFGQANVVSATDSNTKFSDAMGDLDFRLRFQAPLGTSFGLAVNVPYPGRELQTDSLDLQAHTDQGQVSLLLGSELFSLGGEHEDAQQRLFLGFEIPIEKNDGKWGAHLEWVERAGFRARASVWTVTPHQDLQSVDSVGPSVSETWHEVISEGLLAARPFRWLELGLRGTRSQVTPRGIIDELKPQGNVWQGAGSVQIVGHSWRWSNTLEWQREDLQYAWNQDSVNPWALSFQQHSEVWDYNTRLQRSFGNLRIALYDDRRLWDGQPNHWNLTVGDTTTPTWADLFGNSARGDSSQSQLGKGHSVTNIIGTEVRYTSDGFFVEPGIGWAQGYVAAAHENPWQSWGLATGIDSSAMNYHAIVATLNLGLITGGSRFQYSFQQAFPMDASPWRSGLSLTWGAEHRFTVESGF